VSLTAKLQLEAGHTVAVVNPPSGFRLDARTAEHREDAVLLFVRDGQELETLGEPFFRAARDDRLAWLAYPKAGQLETDLNRDILREQTKSRGVRPVRQVSIDEVWSALRFSPHGYSSIVQVKMLDAIRLGSG
jgi:hypothetical protein